MGMDVVVVFVGGCCLVMIDGRKFDPHAHVGNMKKFENH